jgi:hypothetical protein
MSTKTLRKRIALVAVAALGAGVLASAPANAGTAVFVYTTVTGNGIIVAAAGTDVGQTATISSDTVLSITMVAGSDAGAKVTVDGGTIVAISGASGLGTATSLTYGATNTPVVSFKPDAGSGLMTITAYVSTAAAAAGTAAAKLIATVKSSASVGKISSAYSFVSVVAAGTDTDPANNVDVAAGKTVPVGTNGRINFELLDGNNVAMPSGTAVTATATGGCLVGILNVTTSFLSTSATALYLEASTDGSETTGYNDAIFLARSVANAPFTCTVSLTANGVPFATKTLTLQGKVTKVVVEGGNAGISAAYASATSTVVDSGISAQAFAYNLYDAADNIVYGIAPTAFVSTATDAFESVASSMTPDSAYGYGLGDVTCTGLAKGSGSFYISYNNTVGETIKSPSYTVNCFGGPATYTASLDKASYVPGDIATLTITAKDSKGNAANDYVYLGGTSIAGTGLANSPLIAGSNMTAITAPTSTDMFSGGVKKYKFIVGSTEGSYSMSIDLPKFNSTTYSQEAITVAYKIALSSSTIQLADVLKAIVSLIASINKQIAALQKALLKK